MLSVFTIVLLACAAAMAIWAIVHTIIDRATNLAVFIGLAVFELLLFVQLVISIVMVPGSGANAVLEFGYIVTAILIVAGAGFWAYAEVGRWGAGVLTIASLAVGVMIVRMHQIWSAA